MQVCCCSECRYLDLSEGKIISICPRCQGKYVSLGISTKEWNKLSWQQMNERIDDVLSGRLIIDDKEDINVGMPSNIQPFSIIDDEPVSEEVREQVEKIDSDVPRESQNMEIAEEPIPMVEIPASPQEEEPIPMVEIPTVPQEEEPIPMAEIPSMPQEEEPIPMAEIPTVPQEEEPIPMAEIPTVSQEEEPIPMVEIPTVPQEEEPIPMVEIPTVPQEEEPIPMVETPVVPYTEEPTSVTVDTTPTYQAEVNPVPYTPVSYNPEPINPTPNEAAADQKQKSGKGLFNFKSAECAECGRRLGLNRVKVGKTESGREIWKCPTCAKKGESVGPDLVIPVPQPIEAVAPKQKTFESLVPDSAMGELKKYQELVTSGAMTPEEYEIKRRQLLNL